MEKNIVNDLDVRDFIVDFDNNEFTPELEPESSIKKPTKFFHSVKKNHSSYYKILHKLYNESQKKFGKDYLYNYYLQNDFSYRNLNKEFFLKRDCIKHDDNIQYPLLNNAILNKFQHMEKRPINSFYQFVSKENKVTGQYLANVDNKNNITLFAFTMVQNIFDMDKDFTLKLDMCYQGKKWITICRIDSKGNDHINYFTKDKTFENLQDLEIISGPHMHYNCLNKEILSTDKSDYYPAYALSNKIIHTDKELFISCLKYFANETGLKNCINIDTFIQNKSTKQDFFNNPIYLYENENTLI